ncbi:PAS domain-containing protein [Nitratireductor basaltis]|uniref:Blue-light-activated histidine kinase n=1 Tax=Nitratireductor basaltis TaxID=472175 RepID=A0A084U9M6_9HYPH|nr:PAS domain-containing protein [Nitratireductor basaltis]KFB09662.1 Signal transduction histidine kinase [Nitratireductor basaltis]
MTVDFELLFQELSSPYMVLDRQLCFVTANKAYERATNRSCDELVGRNVFDLFPNEGESGQRLKASFKRVLETGEQDTLAYIPYDIPRPESEGGGMEQRYWTAVHTPLADDNGAVEFIVQNTVDVTDLVRLRQAAHLPFRLDEVRLLERAREAERQHQDLHAESENFRRLFQQAPSLIAVLSGPDHVFTFANDAYMRLIGERAILGKPLTEALPEIEGQGYVELLDKVYRTGKAVSGEAGRALLQTEDEEKPREVFFDFTYDPIRDEDGNISGVFVQGMDRTEAVRTQKRQRLLLDELNHRVKNTLATVQSIASQTMRTARDLTSAREDLESRIIALSNAHNILSVQEWANAELSALVNQELIAYGPERYVCKGSWVVLNPKTAIALALVLHEITTNAAKYGALSTAEGCVRIEWKVDLKSGQLVITWQEESGPVVKQPDYKGFGSRMIHRVVEGELDGEFQAQFDSGGYSCRIAIPYEVAVQ